MKCYQNHSNILVFDSIVATLLPQDLKLVSE